MKFLKIILRIFQELSGLGINLEKSEFLITATDETQVHHMARIMGCKPGVFPITYLGMPLSNKKLLKSQYLPLIKKIENKLTSWKASMLSIGGRVILLNATLTAMPLYMM